MTRMLLVFVAGVIIGWIAWSAKTTAQENHIRRGLRSTARYLGGQFVPASRSEIITRTRRGAIVLGCLVSLWALGLAAVHAISCWDSRSAPSPRWFGSAPDSSTDGIVIVVHGWQGDSRTMEDVAETVAEEYPSYAVNLWEYEAGTFSNEDPDDLAIQLSQHVNELAADEQDIILIGHSLGGLLVRRSYLHSLNTWGQQVSRIVLLAAPNRGTKALYRSTPLALLDVLTRSYRVGKLIRSTYRGNEFVVNLRLDWIRAFQNMKNPPIVAQILGREDSLVSASDSRDVLQFRGSIERLAAGVKHASVVTDRSALAHLSEILTIDSDSPELTVVTA